MTSAATTDDTMTLHHAGLYVSDLEKTRDFYTGVLGMKEIARPVDFTFPGAYVKRGGAEVHVVVEIEPDRTAQLRQKWSEEELRIGYVVHFALRVDSLDPYRRSLAERDLQPVGGLASEPTTLSRSTSSTLMGTSSSSCASTMRRPRTDVAPSSP
jgi:catechol 2,3-dioxygenase-like lactoylglutathione lyase family enzyme